MNRQIISIAAGLAIAGGVIWWASRIKPADIGGAVVDLADGLVSNTVETIGEVVGIPKTDMTACERAIAEGRTWEASFVCPAKRFIKYLFE